MLNKKYLILAGLFAAFAVTPAMAQESESASSASWSGRDMTYRGESYDILDSSYYPNSRLDQYRRYMNHQTAFPPKPSNQWEIGVNVGMYNVIGDVPSKNPFSGNSFVDAVGIGATIRKAIGYTFSIRGQYVYGRANGFDYRPGTAYGNQFRVYPVGTQIFYNYRMISHEGSLQLVAAVNNIRFHKAKNSMSLYGFAGPGFLSYKTSVDTRDSRRGDSAYNFAPVFAKFNKANSFDRSNRKEINDYLKQNIFDFEYDNVARDRTQFVGVAGAGLQFRLGSVVTLQLEDKVTFPFDDFLDAVSRQAVNGSLTPDKDIINYASLGLNFNIGNKRKNVAPLWWVNPLDHVYNEISDPRHMRLPDPNLSDDDNDGITNQFDKCPGTPAGVAVDSHGCPMDTDGDGVPDYKDKQMITPTECQPVNADGVGKCPCPDGCGGPGGMACGTIQSGSLNFSGNSSRISSTNQSQLSNLAAQMQANPTCKVVISGMGNGSKVQQQRSWDRVNAVIEYMSEKHGIDRNRFIFQYGASGDADGVMYRSANDGETGNSNVAPPFPNLRRE